MQMEYIGEHWYIWLSVVAFGYASALYIFFGLLRKAKQEGSLSQSVFFSYTFKMIGFGLIGTSGLIFFALSLVFNLRS
ncbi:MAG: hypothetical protein MRY49_01145 [Candidatus Pacebacteria bacterium]|nr:hypothetical protein [Candidatus Paceibacterota bacterium]